MPDYTQEYFEKALKEAQKICFDDAPDIKSSHRKGFVEACKAFQDAPSQKHRDKAMHVALKIASKIFETLDMAKSELLENAILRGVIIYRQGPKELSEFAQENEVNAKMVEALLSMPKVMKEMIANGGAKHGKYGEAMKIYTTCVGLNKEENEFTEVNKKIAMAVALELCSGHHKYFDTQDKIKPTDRFKHFEKAHRKGELDPAFPNFSVWEMRHIVDCDAPNDQMKWGREMLLNYAPYITCVTDETQRYNYILLSDVLRRPPHWTSSPRTYQQVLSGGGNDGPNAWFGRFILKSFGIPVWGAKEDKKEGFVRWTSRGWVPMQDISWSKCSWDGMSGADMKGELMGRTSNTGDEYYKKLTLLECLGEVLDGRRHSKDKDKDDDKDLHPLRCWRSLANIKRSLVIVGASNCDYDRSAPGVVTTNVEKYLDKFTIEVEEEIALTDEGGLRIPPAAFGSSYGNVLPMANWKKTMQVNLLADGYVDYDLHEDLAEKEYALVLEVCTVHLKQSPLFFIVQESGDEEGLPIKIPYTIGKWAKTEPVKVTVAGGQTIRLLRKKPSFGLAIRSIVLKPL